MDNEIIFWELTESQKTAFINYLGYDPGFEYYPGTGLWYLEQTTANLAAYGSEFEDFDMDDGTIGDSYGTHTWTMSTVPSVLWP